MLVDSDKFVVWYVGLLLVQFAILLRLDNLVRIDKIFYACWKGLVTGFIAKAIQVLEITSLSIPSRWGKKLATTSRSPLAPARSKPFHSEVLGKQL